MAMDGRESAHEQRDRTVDGVVAHGMRVASHLVVLLYLLSLLRSLSEPDLVLKRCTVQYELWISIALVEVIKSQAEPSVPKAHTYREARSWDGGSSPSEV